MNLDSVDLVARSRFEPPRRSRMRLAATFAVAAAALAVLVFAAVNVPLTKVTTGPASDVPTTRPPPPPPFTSIPRFPGEVAIAEGHTRAGEKWELFLGGPSLGLCLGVTVLGEPLNRPMVCAGAPSGAPSPDPYRPLINQDLRVTPLVAGQVETGVVSVRVVHAGGRTVAPVPVTESTEGRFYVIEVPDRIKPVAVVGTRADGSTVRYL